MPTRTQALSRPALIRGAHATLPRQGAATPARRGRRRFLLVLANVAGLGFLVFLLFHSPWFAVETVTVRGLDRLSPDEVARLGGITGRNLFLLDVDSAAERIRRGTMARRVEVARSLPNQVTVTVEERTPWAVWKTQAASYLIDEDGVVLGPTPSPPALPVLLDVERHLLDPGMRVDAAAVLLTQRLADLLPARMGQRPVRFEYGPRGGVKAVLNDGSEVRFGSGDDLDYKLAALAVMIDDAEKQGGSLSYADLRFGERSYYRIAEPAAPPTAPPATQPAESGADGDADAETAGG